MEKVLILGAGMVARPIVRYLLEQKIEVTLGDIEKLKAEELINRHPRGTAIAIHMEDEPQIDKLISEHNVIVSLLPWKYHPVVARLCVKNKKSLVTTSYVKEAMSALDAEAKQAGIILLNECGLDPGIDHMSAKKIIDSVHADGGKILGFYSLCGALPAPESANNPFNYKFSWSPRGVIQAGNNDASYLRNGKIVNIATENLFKDTFQLNFPGIGNLYAYPNRDSLTYIDLYEIPEAQTMLRGTLRYAGWCETLDALKALGMTQEDLQFFEGMTYADMMARQVGHDNIENLRIAVAKYLNIDLYSHPIDAMEWLGLFENTPMSRQESSTFDILSDLMIAKMKMKPEDSDMCVMQHQFLIESKNGHREVIKSSLLDFGSAKEDTAIARTVALPAASAVKLILQGKINLTGVHIPTKKEIYEPLLQTLSGLGIRLKEQMHLPEDSFVAYSHPERDFETLT
jgi:saccharopine dehydrogenase-like NADP-dependent oxidoreductase